MSLKHCEYVCFECLCFDNEQLTTNSCYKVTKEFFCVRTACTCDSLCATLVAMSDSNAAIASSSGDGGRGGSSGGGGGGGGGSMSMAAAATAAPNTAAATAASASAAVASGATACIARLQEAVAAIVDVSVSTTLTAAQQADVTAVIQRLGALVGAGAAAGGGAGAGAGAAPASSSTPIIAPSPRADRSSVGSKVVRVYLDGCFDLMHYGHL